METQLVISNVSEKYGHVSSLGVGASLFVFISAALDHFSLPYYAFVLLPARHRAVDRSRRWEAVYGSYSLF